MENGRPLDRETLARIAWMYYREGLIQKEIAERLHVSRATVARLLERAKETGVVTFDIDTTSTGGFELAERVRERFDLQDVAVVPSASATGREGDDDQLAIVAAHYLRRHLAPGAVIGVGWGDTVRQTLLNLRPAQLSNVTFATLTGGIDAYTARMADEMFSGDVKYIPSPIFASSPVIAAILRREESVAAVLDLARTADAALVGIGGVDTEATSVRQGLISRELIEELAARGAIGDILGEWYDSAGRVLDVETHELRIGIGIEELRQMRNVIAVAGGRTKEDAIRGALSGGAINTLITTEDVARSLADH